MSRAQTWTDDEEENTPLVGPLPAADHERTGLLAAGAALVLVGATSRRGWLPRALLAGAGGALLYGAQRGFSPGRALDATTRYLSSFMTEALRPIELQALTHVALPPIEVYRHWRDFRNLPDFLPHLKLVRVHSRLHSHWVIKGMSGIDIGWDVLVNEDRPGRMIGTRSVEGADMQASVCIELAEEGAGTALRLTLRYKPSDTAAAAALAAHFTPGDEHQLTRDLERYRRLAEVQALPAQAIVHTRNPHRKRSAATASAATPSEMKLAQ